MHLAHEPRGGSWLTANGAYMPMNPPSAADFGPPADARWFGDGESSAGSSSRPTTSATFVSARESLDGTTTPRGQQHMFAPMADTVPPTASLVPSIIDALFESAADVEVLAGTVMHLAVLLDSATGFDAVAMGAAMRAGPALGRLVELLGHPDQRVHQATLLVIGNLSTHDFDEDGADDTLDAFRSLGAFERMLPLAHSETPLTVMYALGAIRNQCTSLDEVALLQSSGVLDRLQQLATPRRRPTMEDEEQEPDPMDNPRLRQFAAGCLINVRQVLQASNLVNVPGGGADGAQAGGSD